MELANLLAKTGLTGHEARLYALLLGGQSYTGYEAAKATGISRSNVYLALEGLADKGGAYRIEGEAARYTAVPIEEYLRNIARDFTALLANIRRLAPHPLQPPESYVTITGDDKIRHKMCNMLDGAQQRVYLSMALPIVQSLIHPLGQAVARGLKVVITTDAPFALEGAQVYHTQKPPAQVRLIADSQQVLTGTLRTQTQEAVCLFTANQTIVTLFKEALRSEIELIQLKQIPLKTDITERGTQPT